jgi:hypothetical protein
MNQIKDPEGLFKPGEEINPATRPAWVTPRLERLSLNEAMTGENSGKDETTSGS